MRQDEVAQSDVRALSRAAELLERHGQRAAAGAARTLARRISDDALSTDMGLGPIAGRAAGAGAGAGAEAPGLFRWGHQPALRAGRAAQRARRRHSR